MLTEIRLINFKSFLNEKIALKPISLFIGPNGSGKSTIASALYAISTSLRLGLSAAFPDGFFSFWNIRHFEAMKCGYKHPPIGMGLSGVIDSFKFDYDIIFTRTNNSRSRFYINYEGIRIQSENFSCNYKTGQEPELAFKLPTAGPDEWIDGLDSAPQRDCLFMEAEDNAIDQKILAYLKRIKKYMRLMSKYQFQASTARNPCDKYDGAGRQPFLKSDASNLAEVVQYLQEEKRGCLAQLKDWVRKYAEGGNRIVDLGVGIVEEKVFLNFFEEGREKNAFEVRGPLVSDGYWIFTAFASLASSDALPSIAFFEEPESHLHPHKLPILCEVFKSMADHPESPCQILISSHSPYFLDLFKDAPDSVIFLTNGKAVNLTDCVDYENILSLYSLGEAWYSNIFNWGNPE